MDIDSRLDGPAGTLSNFTLRPFVFQGVGCQSMEGLLQSLKWQDTQVQKQMCGLVGIRAKRKGYKQDWWTDQTLYWNNIAYPRLSEDYQQLLDAMFTALYTQNKEAQDTLLDTGHEPLTHKIGKIHQTGTILTRDEFCFRLMDIRAFYQAREFIEF